MVPVEERTVGQVRNSIVAQGACFELIFGRANGNQQCLHLSYRVHLQC